MCLFFKDKRMFLNGDRRDRFTGHYSRTFAGFITKRISIITVGPGDDI